MIIMVVEDSETQRFFIKHRLEKIGFDDIMEAENGEEAMIQLELCKPDVILLDWAMPEMDGITFLRKLRENDQSTAVIMVTTTRRRNEVQEAIEAGVNDYIVKPYELDMLEQKIHSVLDTPDEAHPHFSTARLAT